MKFNDIYAMYRDGHKKVEAAEKLSREFFEKFDLDYSINFCDSDGVLLLNPGDDSNAILSAKAIEALTLATTDDEVIHILSKLEWIY